MTDRELLESIHRKVETIFLRLDALQAELGYLPEIAQTRKYAQEYQRYLAQEQSDNAAGTACGPLGIPLSRHP